jgi:2-keto-4-pentenoate hydratase/2-oxohepta-3-ene-1,7-dioic acid hydratase in catechol pathway
MKIVRFRVDSGEFQGQVVENKIVSLPDGAPLKHEYRLQDVQLLAPCKPSKIVAVGLNYQDHAKELNLPLPEEPLLFLKPQSSIIGPGETIILPPQSSRVDYEAELAIVIKKVTKNVSAKNAAGHILGYTCLNDVTARDLQSKDGQWTRAKGFDTFCPIGPWIVTGINPSNLDIQLLLNGKIKQHSSTANLIFNCFTLVEFVSHVMTLFPGDVIATGTTSGIGPMKAGDSIEVVIQEIGTLTNSAASIH